MSDTKSFKSEGEESSGDSDSSPSATQSTRFHVGKKFQRALVAFLKNTAAGVAIARKHDIKVEPESEESESEPEPTRTRVRGHRLAEEMESEPEPSRNRAGGRWLAEEMEKLRRENKINFDGEPTMDEIFKQIRLPSSEQILNWRGKEPIRRWIEVHLEKDQDPIPWLSWSKNNLPEEEIKKDPDRVPPSPPRLHNMMGVSDYKKLFNSENIPNNVQLFKNVKNALESNEEEVCIYQKSSCSILRTTRKSLLEKQKKKKIVEEYGRRDRRDGRGQSGAKGKYDGRKDPRLHRDGARFRSYTTQRVGRRDSYASSRRSDNSVEERARASSRRTSVEERAERRSDISPPRLNRTSVEERAERRSDISPPRLNRTFVEERAERRSYRASSRRSDISPPRKSRKRGRTSVEDRAERRSDISPPRKKSHKWVIADVEDYPERRPYRASTRIRSRSPIRRHERWSVEKEERRRKEWVRRSQTPPRQRRDYHTWGRSEERRDYHTLDRSEERSHNKWYHHRD